MRPQLDLRATLPTGPDYRRAPGFPRHFVGSDGTVWKFLPDGWRELRQPVVGPVGYRRVTLCDGGKRWKGFVHALVLLCFHGPRPAGMVCRHLDGNARNNTPGNLRWDTVSENSRDRKRHGRCSSTGVKNSQAILTDEAVLEIRRRRRAGEKLTSIASAFRINFRTVSEIANGKRWPHLLREEMRPHYDPAPEVEK